MKELTFVTRMEADPPAGVNAGRSKTASGRAFWLAPA